VVGVPNESEECVGLVRERITVGWSFAIFEDENGTVFDRQNKVTPKRHPETICVQAFK
jgi:hypothetical protein